ncbi:hypothetical protein CYMTET_26430 [Cymbomonas tetramitiformis]|uniref:Uncharacterized protein n=1 Tax=Cymbomonas tetramitiformis TaxID=36881 RepID=A0AAE0KXY1_9CHLO|nr:hypothetical protein CYMTET_26430 [Cymbomonas tetramitiformis]
MSTRVHDARHALRQLIKQAACGAGDPEHRFPMAHFGAAVTDVIESPSEMADVSVELLEQPPVSGMPQPQLVYGCDEPPFQESFILSSYQAALNGSDRLYPPSQKCPS